MARPYGILPRDLVEDTRLASASEVNYGKPARFSCACSAATFSLVKTPTRLCSLEPIFARMRIGEKVRAAARFSRGLSELVSSIPMAKRYAFEELKIIPQEWRRELLSPIVGSHDPRAQKIPQLLAREGVQFVDHPA